MKKCFFLSLFSLIITSTIIAQGFTITGTVRDQENNTSLQNASASLNSITDTSFSRTVLTDSTGQFYFRNINRDSFLLTVSYSGYTPVARGIRIDTADVNINISMVQGKSGELATVVITYNPPMATQKEDTIQYNASQFKVNPDASGEDLVRKMPGITVEDGQIKAGGENVQKVTIDGRELFGDDATAALRNLPAEIIDKIQVFDRLSDQAQFTGLDDGNTTRAINVVTKANMRNGQFGRVYAGYGTDGRYSLGGNATILNENRRISLVGNFNNINQQNFSQQDLLGLTSNTGRGSGRGGRSRGNNPRQRGGQGGFGSNSNFLVGQQNGINETNAMGINYSDLWGAKITVSGSYFFNNTDNATNEFANTEYFENSKSSILNIRDTTVSSGRNNNHRFNLRMEYKIDSFNQLIIIPTLGFQNNTSNQRNASLQFFKPGDSLEQSFNENISKRHTTGNNLNNTVLYRRSFDKRGRSFSINLNTSTNKKDGEFYVNTFTRNIDSAGNSEDVLSNRFTDQQSDGYNLSANLVYTEPVGENSQLHFNYNPGYSRSKANQQAFGYDPVESKYNEFLPSFSNKFENRTTEQNAGISYRNNTKERQYSFGLNFQHTNLNSERIFPITTSVNKSFNNLLPNAMFRYHFSTRSNLRLMYRARVNQPSVTQLQDVLDPTNAPSYNLGNPELAPQYMHILSSRYTYTNTTRNILVMANIFYQAADKYITSASFNGARDTVVNGEELNAGYRLTTPVNLNGYRNLRSFMTIAVPLKFIKSNFNLNGGISFSRLPGLLNNEATETNNTTYSLGGVVASNVSQYVDFTFSYSANFNDINTKQDKQESTTSYFQHIAGLQLNLLTKNGWFFQNELNNQYYNGLTEGFNQTYWLWNMSIGKKFLKDQKGELKLSVFDLLKQNRSIVRNITESYLEDVQNEVLKQYFLLTFTYNLRNFGPR